MQNLTEFYQNLDRIAGDETVPTTRQEAAKPPTRVKTQQKAKLCNPPKEYIGFISVNETGAKVSGVDVAEGTSIAKGILFFAALFLIVGRYFRRKEPWQSLPPLKTYGLEPPQSKLCNPCKLKRKKATS